MTHTNLADELIQAELRELYENAEGIYFDAVFFGEGITGSLWTRQMRASERMAAAGLPSIQSQRAVFEKGVRNNE